MTAKKYEYFVKKLLQVKIDGNSLLTNHFLNVIIICKSFANSMINLHIKRGTK